jgi:hypothetical protein
MKCWPGTDPDMDFDGTITDHLLVHFTTQVHEEPSHEALMSHSEGHWAGRTETILVRLHPLAAF